MTDLSELERLSVWIDGELRPPADAVVSVWDHGLLYGDGVFEGIRLRDGALYRVSDHLERLRRSCRIVALELPYSDEELVDAIRDAAAANHLRDAHVRILVTRGRGLPGIDPRRCSRATVIVLVYPFPPLLGNDPITLVVSSVVRKAPRSVDPGAKSLNYLDSVLAKIQANEAGAGDALMLDGQGLVAEATGTNVFCVMEGTLRTPPLTASLPGVTRRTVIELAHQKGVSVAIEPLTVGDLYVADEVFLTGTAAGIVPVAAVDGRKLPDPPGPLTRLIDEAYRRTWTDPRYVTPIL